jgi:hypothetical protein
MIGTIRKHSAWLWWVIAGLTIISFVVFMGSGPGRNGGRGGTGDFGTIYGRKVTAQEYVEARNAFYIFYRLHYGEWPDHAKNFTDSDRERETYIRILLDRKATALGVHVSDDVIVAAAGEMLRTLGRNGQPETMDRFVNEVLAQEGLTAADFKRFVSQDLTIQQLVQVMGLPGALITPQEAAAFYQREHQELSVQAVFFSASNYLAQIVATPGAVAQFYTNYLAAYRLPDRVQVNYVAFELSNHLAAAEQKIGPTNLDSQVEAIFRDHGMDAIPGAKTADEEKLKIRAALIRQEAAVETHKAANDFAGSLFTNDPVQADNLVVVAKKFGIPVHSTAPFSASSGPAEFSAPDEFIKAAFSLTTDDPLAGPVAGPDAIYVLALAGQLPSEIPPLDQIRARVTQDFQQREAALAAQRAGTNFVTAILPRLAAGKTFAAASVAAGYSPEVLPPFSLSTGELPELGDRVELNLLKRAAFTTSVGHTSGLVETDDGGFVLFVQSQLPLDQAAMNAQLPQFASQLRRGRQNEAFNNWLQAEASRELRNVPALRQQADAAR